jgi:hypothetical protein
MREFTLHSLKQQQHSNNIHSCSPLAGLCCKCDDDDDDDDETHCGDLFVLRAASFEDAVMESSDAVGDRVTGGVLDAVYELCAVVAHVRDADEEPLGVAATDGAATSLVKPAASMATPEKGGAAAAAVRSGAQHVSAPTYDGHLVAMIKVRGFLQKWLALLS